MVWLLEFDAQVAALDLIYLGKNFLLMFKGVHVFVTDGANKGERSQCRFVLC